MFQLPMNLHSFTLTSAGGMCSHLQLASSVAENPDPKTTLELGGTVRLRSWSRDLDFPNIRYPLE